MVLDFHNMEEVMMEHMRGGEKSVGMKTYNDGKNKIILGRLLPGASIGFHIHETNSETIYVLQGNGKMIVEGGEERLSAGMGHYCPKGTGHSFVNDSEEDILFFAVVPEQA